MDSEQDVKQRLDKTIAAVRTFAEKSSADLVRAAEMIVQTLSQGGKILIFGNGGSAAEAQHIAAELVNRMLKDRGPLAAVALTTDTSIITSIANDYNFDRIFEKQLRALGRKGDLAWGISTSGTSRNVNLALEAAKDIGMKTLGMAGRPDSLIGGLTEHCLWVEADSTPVIQEVQLAAAHIICEMVEREMFGGEK